MLGHAIAKKEKYVVYTLIPTRQVNIYALILLGLNTNRWLMYGIAALR